MTQHTWIKSELSANERVCSACGVTDREAALRGGLNQCGDAPPVRSSSLNARTLAFMAAAARLSLVGEKELSEALSHGALHLKQNEPFFVLRGQDLLAPGALRAWVEAARLANVPEWKIEKAEDVWERMQRWSGDRKHPD